MALIKMNFLSKELGMQTNISVVLPSYSFNDVMNGREEVYVPGMKYQVMYLLHGTTGDDSDYVNFSNIVRYADDNKIAVVMPCGFNSDYLNFPNGIRYYDFITKELPKVVETLFPISTKREDTIIAGLSMGGCGAMNIALSNPEKFGSVLLMSGVTRVPEQVKEMINNKSNAAMGGMSMPDLVSVYDFDNFEGSVADGYYHAKKNVELNKPLPKFFLACGGNDRVLGSVEYAYDHLKEIGYEVEFKVTDGYAHEWDFWDLTLKEALKNWLPIKHSVLYPED